MVPARAAVAVVGLLPPGVSGLSVGRSALIPGWSPR